MIKRLLILAGLVLPLLATAQKGIVFDEADNWRSVIEKSAAAGKYVFVDIYASWCVPCKVMDKDVYRNDSVGAFMNANFISVKLQADTTARESERNVKLRETTRAFVKNNSINGYPYFLILSPDGNVVHKGAGYKGTAQFLAFAKASLDTNRQLLPRIERWRKGKLPEERVAELISDIKELNDDSLRNEMTRDHLKKMDPTRVFETAEVKFVASAVKELKPGDGVFKEWMRHPGSADSAFGHNGIAMSVVTYVIWQELFADPLAKANQSNEEPDWRKLSKASRKKYGAHFTQQVLLDARTKWYQSHQDKAHIYAVYVERFRMNGIDTAGNRGVTNNMAWEIFLDSQDVKQLTAAADWMHELVRFEEPGGTVSTATENDQLNYGNSMSTLAHILYKLKRKDEAILFQGKAMDIAYRTKHPSAIRSWGAELEKMKNNIPTWPTASK